MQCRYQKKKKERKKEHYNVYLSSENAYCQAYICVPLKKEIFYFVIGDMYILKSVYTIVENDTKVPFVFTFDGHENGIKVLINLHVGF